ncbi:sigma-70 family RNA polymerase sigma factor [Mycolicibacterium sp. Dal123E01]|uniref:sigma-70 family RNA polymerase sigma factor n=1 Tax=Mycolicibacterium sp. Dal123E01 TaxID=3457578 RepID=UPI00403E9BEB
MPKNIDRQRIASSRCEALTQLPHSDIDGPRESAAELTARFESEVQPLIDSLHRGARRLTFNAADAEDLVQDTLMHAYIGFRTFQPGTNIQAWLFRILKNQSINIYRMKQRRPDEFLAEDFTDPVLASEAAKTCIGTRSAEYEALQALPDTEIRSALAQLSEGLRATVYYADVEGLPYREIAEILDIPLGTVMSRVHRGRGQLRESLFDVVRDRGLYREQLTASSERNSA